LESNSFRQASASAGPVCGLTAARFGVSRTAIRSRRSSQWVTSTDCTSKNLPVGKDGRQFEALFRVKRLGGAAGRRKARSGMHLGGGATGGGRIG
jgi:hypothetical protein